MAEEKKIAGGSSNVFLNLVEDPDNHFQLTGLDANGQVLLTVNVTIVKGSSSAVKLYMYLPSIASLNFRKVSFILNIGDYDKQVFLFTQPNDFFNGLDLSTTPLSYTAIANISGKVTVGSDNSWTSSRPRFNPS